MPRPPWKWIISLGLFVALAYGTYQANERREEAILREAIHKAHGEKLGPIVTRYQKMVGQVISFTESAAKLGEAKPYADKRLNLDALHTDEGIYLRLKWRDGLDKAKIASAGLEMPPDAIAKCLGLAPQSAAELFVRGSFLEKDWVKQADSANKMKLRVMAHEIKERSDRDLPGVSAALAAKWFLLVLERGDNRRDFPVDVYLWDLRSDKLLLSTRAQAEGALVSARIAVSGVKPGNYASGAQTGAAQDCSIAAQLRAVTGSAPATFEAEPPTPREALQGAPAPAPTATPAPTSPTPTLPAP